MSDKLKEKSKRVRRLHIEENGPLYIDPKYKREGFFRRIVRDTPGQIAKFERLGYTIVKGDIQIGDQKAGDMTQLGSAVQVELGRSKPMRGILMEIPEELHSELQAEKNEILDEEIEATLTPEIPEANLYGEVNLRNHKFKK